MNNSHIPTSNSKVEDQANWAMIAQIIASVKSELTMHILEDKDCKHQNPLVDPEYIIRNLDNLINLTAKFLPGNLFGKLDNQGYSFVPTEYYSSLTRREMIFYILCELLPEFDLFVDKAYRSGRSQSENVLIDLLSKLMIASKKYREPDNLRMLIWDDDGPMQACPHYLYLMSWEEYLEICDRAHNLLSEGKTSECIECLNSLKNVPPGKYTSEERFLRDSMLLQMHGSLNLDHSFLPNIDLFEDHKLVIIIPSLCKCKRQLPVKLRSRLLNEVQEKFNTWFGGTTGNPNSEGSWNSASGDTITENVYVLYANFNTKRFLEHWPDFIELAKHVADQLFQERVYYELDKHFNLIPSTNPDAPCCHI